MGVGLSRGLAGALLGLELLVLVSVGVHVVCCHSVFGPIDERGHYSYVQFVAERGRLPLLRDSVGPEVSALSRGTYPELPARPPALMGIWGKVYEAFQPPTYYVIAAVVSRSSEDHRAQVTLLRVFGLTVLVGVAIALVRLSGRVQPDDWPCAAAFVVNVVLLPGIVVRSVHVGNAGLEILFCTMFSAFAFRGLSERQAGWVHGAGVVLGAALLTRLTSLSFVVPYLVVVALGLRRRILSARGALAALAIPPILVAPWVAFNLAHYGAFTANGVARGMQMHLVNPEGHTFDVTDAWRDLVEQVLSFQQMFMPQEAPLVVGSPGGDAIGVVSVALFVAPLFAVPFLRADREAWLFALPLPSAVGLWLSAYALSDWPMVVRYLYPALPSSMVLAYLALRRVVSFEVATAVASALFAFLVWIWTRTPAGFG